MKQRIEATEDISEFFYEMSNYAELDIHIRKLMSEHKLEKHQIKLDMHGDYDTFDPILRFYRLESDEEYTDRLKREEKNAARREKYKLKKNAQVVKW